MMGVINPPLGTLLCVLEHPTQYDPPLWSRLTKRGRVRPLVWYLRGAAPDDPEIAQRIEWGIPVGRGYEMGEVRLGELRTRIARVDRLAAVLVSGWVKRSTWECRLAARRARVPTILPTDKTPTPPKESGVRHKVKSTFHVLKSRAFDGFFTTGMLGLEELRRIGVPAGRVALGYYPVDVAFWRERVAASAHRSRELRASVGADRFVIVAVAKMSERENPLLLIETMAFLRTRVPSAHLIFAGNGPLRAQVEQRIRELGLERSITLLGYVKYPDLATTYGAADVFVHVPTDEPWGISLGEAMASGLPCVATRSVGSSHDLIEPGLTGELAEPGDPVDVAAALERVALADRARMRTAVSERVCRIDVDAVSANLEGLIERLRAPEPWPALSRALAGAFTPSSVSRNHSDVATL